MWQNSTWWGGGQGLEVLHFWWPKEPTGLFAAKKEGPSVFTEALVLKGLCAFLSGDVDEA
jgi:hypothetical protein